MQESGRGQKAEEMPVLLCAPALPFRHPVSGPAAPCHPPVLPASSCPPRLAAAPCALPPDQLVASDIVLPCCMIGGNVFFLSAIKRKRHWTTRYFILVNGAARAAPPSVPLRRCAAAPQRRCASRPRMAPLLASGPRCTFQAPWPASRAQPPRARTRAWRPPRRLLRALKSRFVLLLHRCDPAAATPAALPARAAGLLRRDGDVRARGVHLLGALVGLPGARAPRRARVRARGPGFALALTAPHRAPSPALNDRVADRRVQDFEFEAALAAVEQAAADADRQAAAEARRSSRLAAAAAAAGAASLAAVSSRSWRLGSMSVAGAAPFRDLRSPLASPLGRGTAGGSHGGGPLGGGMEDSVCGSSGRCSVGDLEQSCRSAASMESQRRLLKRQGSSMVIVPGFGVLRRAIEGLTDRIEQQQATASRVSLNLPCMGGKDEWPIFTLVLMALTCALIWGMMLTTIHLHIGALGEVDHGEDGGGRR